MFGENRKTNANTLLVLVYLVVVVFNTKYRKTQGGRDWWGSDRLRTDDSV